jgi:hypothetical protein
MKKVHITTKEYLYMKVNEINAFFRGTKSPVNKIKSYYKCIPENRKKKKKRYVATQRKIALL